MNARHPSEVGEVALVLCDFAEVVNGKVYMSGGAWSQVRADQPFNFAVAVFWRIPWTRANRKHKFVLRLLQEDGEPVLAGEGGDPVLIEGAVEVGRPPGLKAGSDLHSPLAMKFNGLQFPAGGYRFDFDIDGSPEASVSFESLGAMP